MKTREAAKGRWSLIFSALGVDPMLFQKKKRTACPRCGGKDRYRYTDKYQAGDFFCNHCEHGDGFDVLQSVFGWEFSDAAKRVDEAIGNSHDGERKERTVDKDRQRLRRIQSGCLSVQVGDPVYLYLEKRGLQTTDTRFLKHHPKMPYYKDQALVGYFPAMIAVYSSPERVPVSVHVTYLTPEGDKAPVEDVKKILPKVRDLSWDGGSLKLSEPAIVLGVCEGIETALACQLLHKIPVWACANATFLPKFKAPAETKKIVIFGDNDASYTGHAAAYALAKKMVSDGLKVEVKLPPQVGTDFADMVASA